MSNALSIDKKVKYSSFMTNEGSEEFFISVDTESSVPFSESLESLHKDYLSAINKCGLSQETQVFCRFYLSDIANQKDDLAASKVFGLVSSGAYSVIQQCPLNGSSMILFAYHVKAKKNIFKKEILTFDNEHWRNGIKITGGSYDLLWTGNFSGYGELDSYEQTNEIFSSYNNLINNNGMTLLKNTVRTWVYVRDIDNNYQGMGDSRASYLFEQGLTKDTRYIASTGIEAKMKEPSSLVSLDAYSISNLESEQIVRMEALDNLCPTHDYGITFERGTKVQFGDRSHLFISGTASIDKQGDVLYHSDAKRQTQRTLENIQALLRPHRASLDDMVYLIVYLRNITEADKVKKVVESYINNNIPVIFVEGAVCRSEWLVEIEGVGIIKDKNNFPAF